MTQSDGPEYEPVRLAVRSAAPARFPPVTLDEAKTRCEIPTANTGHDADLGRLIDEATEFVELDLAEIAATGDYTWKLPQFPDKFLRLPYRNADAVDSIKYDDDAGDEQTLDPAKYQLVAGAVWPAIWPAPGETWPTTQQDNPEAVVVAFKAGYADEAAVPERFKQAVLARVRWSWVGEDQADGMRRLYESIVGLRRSSYP